MAGLAAAFARGSMTNNWTDIGNATLVIAMGANPTENHPACMAHVNRARRGPGTWKDGAGNSWTSAKPAAKLVVIDPRKTRTALQADHYVRIRPGTDIAFLNAVMNYILDAGNAGTGLNDPAYATQKTGFDAFHKATIVGRKFVKAGSSVGGASVATLSDAWPRYSDAAFKVTAASATNADYKRVDKSLGVASVATPFENMPDYEIGGDGKPDIYAAGTVLSTLKAHVAPYTTAVAAQVCGCTEAEIILVAKLLLENSRIAGSSTDPKNAGHRATTFLYAMGLTQHTYGSQNCKELAVVQTLLGNMGLAGGGINALRGIHNVQGSTDMGLLYGNIPAYSGNPGVGSSFGSYLDGLFGNRVGAKTRATLTVGAADSQVLYSARFGGTGGNSLQVAHLAAAPNQTLSVAVSGNNVSVTLATDGAGVVTSTADDVIAAVNGWAAASLIIIASRGAGAGTGLAASQALTALSGGTIDYSSAYTFGNNGLQQKGFFSMTKAFFSDTSYRGVNTRAAVAADPAVMLAASAIPETVFNLDALYSVWPKGNGHNHIKMFRQMALGNTKAAVVWGQNPAVTEPNQGSVREGLKKLKLLVVTDTFETETGACDRDAGTATYLIPACAYVEEAGSVTNSGRVLQWRYECAEAPGNTRPDLELLLRFAYAIEQGGGFQHIKDMWGTLKDAGGAALNLGWADAYAKLFGGQYGWTPGAAFDSESVAVNVAKQMTAPQNTGGTIWIYLDAWQDGSGNAAARGFSQVAGSVAPRVLDAAVPETLFGLPTHGLRHKARSRADQNGNLLYANWGYAWLVNRRVLYNDGNVLGDQADTFQSPELVARMFTSTNANIIDYGQSYRTIHRLNDVPRKAGNSIPTIHVLPGRFPAHTEPYESPYDGSDATKPNFVATWGKNSSTDTSMGTETGNSYENLVMSGTTIGTSATFPLVLTTIRCVEHFQGGPTTRNNWLNVEAEPEPWIELNSYDARLYGIKDGDMVKIVTARTEGFANDKIDSIYPRAEYGAGFRARVGSGLSGNQRVGQGVVAIPWHWGDRGLSTGSRANDLTIDAMDANTTIPEYKACLCRVEKI